MNEIIEVLGASLIAKERSEQIHKHGRTIVDDIKFNGLGQLPDAAISLLMEDRIAASECRPYGWNTQIWEKMYNKPYLKRLVTAGALIAAEIDRYINVTARKYE